MLKGTMLACIWSRLQSKLYSNLTMSGMTAHLNNVFYEQTTCYLSQLWKRNMNVVFFCDLLAEVARKSVFIMILGYQHDFSIFSHFLKTISASNMLVSTIFLGLGTLTFVRKSRYLRKVIASPHGLLFHCEHYRVIYFAPPMSKPLFILHWVCIYSSVRL